MAPGGALDDVGGPGGVVETAAPVRALHTTVAAEEIATHAETEAVALVVAEELVGRHRGHPGQTGAVAVIVHQALCLLQVSDGWQPLVVAGVDHPLHLAGTFVRVAGHQKCGLLCNTIELDEERPTR